MSSSRKFDRASVEAGLAGANEKLVRNEVSPGGQKSQKTLLDEAVHQLRVQNEALVHTADNLAVERLRYRQLYDSIPDPCITTDVNGNVADANDAACKMLDLKLNHVRHKPLVALVPGQERRRFRQFVLTLKKGHERQLSGLNLVPRNSPMPIELTATATPLLSALSEVIEIHWTFKSATSDSRKSARNGGDRTQETAAHERSGVTGEAVSYSSAQSRFWAMRRDIPELLDFTVTKVADFLGAHCFLSLLSRDKKTLVPTAAAVRHKKSAAMLDQFLLAKPSRIAGNAAGKVIQSQQAVIFGNDSKNKNGQGAVPAKGALNMLMVPLRGATDSTGLITILREKDQEQFQEQEITLVQNLADHLALILEIHELEPLAKQARKVAVENATLLANACTELQGPMHALDGFAAMLLEQLEDAQLTEMEIDAKSICEAAAQVNEILSDLLTLSRIESGLLTPSLDKLTIREFLNDIETDVRNTPGVNHCTLKYLGDDVASSIRTDSMLVRQAISRFFSACQRAVETVSLECICSANKLELHLACDGGLLKKNLDQLSCEVPQLNGQSESVAIHKARLRNGGLALLLCHRLCSLLGGNLNLQADSEQAWTAVITLPLA